MTILDKLADLEKKATPGPWHIAHIDENLEHAEIESPEGVPVASVFPRIDQSFICALRDAAPALIEIAIAAKRLKGTYLLRLLHGDEEHQQWLKDEAAVIFHPLEMALARLEASK